MSEQLLSPPEDVRYMDHEGHPQVLGYSATEAQDTAVRHMLQADVHERRADYIKEVETHDRPEDLGRFERMTRRLRRDPKLMSKEEAQYLQTHDRGTELLEAERNYYLETHRRGNVRNSLGIIHKKLSALDQEERTYFNKILEASMPEYLMDVLRSTGENNPDSGNSTEERDNEASEPTDWVGYLIRLKDSKPLQDTEQRQLEERTPDGRNVTSTDNERLPENVQADYAERILLNFAQWHYGFYEASTKYLNEKLIPEYKVDFSKRIEKGAEEGWLPRELRERLKRLDKVENYFLDPFVMRFGEYGRAYGLYSGLTDEVMLYPYMAPETLRKVVYHEWFHALAGRHYVEDWETEGRQELYGQSGLRTVLDTEDARNGWLDEAVTEHLAQTLLHGEPYKLHPINRDDDGTYREERVLLGIVVEGNPARLKSLIDAYFEDQTEGKPTAKRAKVQVDAWHIREITEVLAPYERDSKEYNKELRIVADRLARSGALADSLT